MTEADRKQWGDLLKHYGALFGRVLPIEQAEAWYEELKPYHVVVVSEAMQNALAAHKGTGWFPIAGLLEQCRTLHREAARAEENALQREKLRRAVETRGGDGLGFVDGTAESGEFSDADTMQFADAIYTVSQTQEGRDWLAKQVCCPGDGTSPKMGGGAWGWRRILEPWQEPRPRPLCIILAKCIRNSINCTRNGDRLDGKYISPEKWLAVMLKERAEMHDYVSRIVRKASEMKRIDGKMAAAGAF